MRYSSNASPANSVGKLPRSLSSLEAWGFGLSGLLLWLGTAPSMHSALGAKAIWVWLPATVIGILLNLQVKQLGTFSPDLSGGTPNYTTQLLAKYPLLASYGAIGYWLGWVSVPPMNAIILTELINANLESLGMSVSIIPVEVIFTVLPYIVAFSGTRALSIFHGFFVFPAVGLLLLFCSQGLGWLAIAPNSPGILPPQETAFSWSEWAKWFFIAVYAAYGCETASCFVADSRRPNTTLQCLTFAASLLPMVYLGGSWLLMRLGTQPGVDSGTFSNLVAAATPFWGEMAPFLVTFLVVSGCLLSSATAVSNSPRVLYQLALDRYLAPVFAVVSPRGVLGPALAITFLSSLLCLIWGDVARVVMVTGTGYLTSMMSVHLGLWLQRKHSAVRWPVLSLVFFGVEAIALVVGGLSWGWQDWLLGLSLAPLLMIANALLQQIRLAPFHPSWWRNFYRQKRRGQISDSMLIQVLVLIVLVCGATAVGWLFRARLDQLALANHANLFVVLMMAIALIGVTVACWTTLPQIASITEAREQAEHLFAIALDSILVVDEDGVIQQANPATQYLLQSSSARLIGHPLKKFLPQLPENPALWQKRSEQSLICFDQTEHIVKMAVSEQTHQDNHEYVVILHDISDRIEAELALQETLQQKENLALQATQQAEELVQTLKTLKQTQTQLVQTEKMSSLGQLVAGVAHEINNPVNFIYGNLNYANDYANDLLNVLQVFLKHYPNPVPQVKAELEAVDLDFLAEDLPKLFASMKVGTERIRQIVLSLRNFSRLDEAEVKPIDIHEGIDSTLMILGNRLKSKGDRSNIEVIREYGTLPLVECYGGQLNQVFMNLLSNAIDALEDAYHQQKQLLPCITIRTEVIDKEQVMIRVIDNGPGIPESVQSRLFDPFFTTKPVGKGTGMGLSISYQIVAEKHGGMLTCRSEPGQGTEFVVQIPIRQSVVTEALRR